MPGLAGSDRPKAQGSRGRRESPRDDRARIPAGRGPPGGTASMAADPAIGRPGRGQDGKPAVNAGDVRSVTELEPGTTIAFAGSGGLDSCTITRWLADRGIRVICLTGDLGQPDEDDIGDIERRMLAAGAAGFRLIPLTGELAEAGLRLVQADARYDGGYWNTTGIARHVLVHGLARELAGLRIGCLAHGSTGRGNDQVRFQVALNHLAPSVRLYAPWRDEEFLARFRGRADMIDFCTERKIPIRATKQDPYSTDANMLGLTHEAGDLESLDTPATLVRPVMTRWPQDAPDEPEAFEVRFEAGRPVRINGRAVGLAEAFRIANERAGAHGIGLVHVVENRLVGLKSRGIYEQPGIELLGHCYELLRQLVLDAPAREFFAAASRVIAAQVYAGRWFTLASSMAERAVEEVSRLVTGTVRVDLYKGAIIERSLGDAPHSLYRGEHVSMEAVGDFDHHDSEGMLRIMSLGARALAEAGQARDRLAGGPGAGGAPPATP